MKWWLVKKKMGKLGKGAQNKVEELWKKEIQVGGTAGRGCLLCWTSVGWQQPSARLEVRGRSWQSCLGTAQPARLAASPQQLPVGTAVSGEEEQGAGEAEAGSHPPGTHGKGSQGSSQMAPSIPTLAAPPGTAALGAPQCAGAKLCWKKKLTLLLWGHVHIFCWVFCCQYTWPTGVLLPGLVQCLTRWGFGLKNERWVIVCLS